jgi:hypothetical protein
MLRIGDFAQLSRVSTKALRIYDRLGLLKPCQVDATTGYRFYLQYERGGDPSQYVTEIQVPVNKG